MVEAFHNSTKEGFYDYFVGSRGWLKVVKGSVVISGVFGGSWSEKMETQVRVRPAKWHFLLFFIYHASMYHADT